MILGQRLVVVMPAYNAAKTLEKTYREIPLEYVDEVILVDDASQDETISYAKSLGITAEAHHTNMGYGGNQKTCYRLALEKSADIVVMLHPDYQYDPRLITAMASMVASGVYDFVLGSRILGNETLRGGMPFYKYVSNRVLTLIQNLLMGTKLSEFHTGYRAFHRRVLEALPLDANSDDFLFDNQMLAQAAFFGFRIGEISCPTKYFPEASSINFWRSLIYGMGVIKTSLQFRGAKLGLWRLPIFQSRNPAVPIHAKR
jgi:glycosyltransferase involved in cell wall biosynthesis